MATGDEAVLGDARGGGMSDEWDVGVLLRRVFEEVWTFEKEFLRLSSLTFFFESVMAVTGDLCCEEEKEKAEKMLCWCEGERRRRQAERQSGGISLKSFGSSLQTIIL